MRNRRGLEFILIMMLVTLSGCGKPNYSPQGTIRFKVKSVATKGTVETTETVGASGFVVDAWIDDDYHGDDMVEITDHYYIQREHVTKSGSTWSMSSDHYWINDVKFRFWSYTQATLDAIAITDQDEGQDHMTFTYSNTDAQTDLIFAYNEQTCTFTGSESEVVNITFYHALAQIRFAICASDDSFAKNDFELVSITTGNIYGAGTCTFTGPSTFAWTPSGDMKAYSQSLSADFASSCPSGWSSVTKSEETNYICDDVIFVVPQTTDASSYVQIKLKRKSDNTEFTRKALLPSDVWSGGEYYTYRLKATSKLNQDIEFEVEAVDWEDYGDDIPLN